MNDVRTSKARKLSLLFINQHYEPDFAATGQLLTDLAEYLAADGYDVSVLCSRGHYLSGTVPAPRREVRNGVAIHRLGAVALGRATHLGRLLDYAGFFGQALWVTLAGRRYDYVVTLTTPPLLGVLGAVVRKVRGQRYGIWSMDLHPDAEEALGMIRPGSAPARALHALNDAAYRRADFVVDLGPFMKQRLLDKGVPGARLHTIPVWNKAEEVRPLPRPDNPLVDELGLGGKFVVMYSGNAGLAHRFEEVLDAMYTLKDHPDIFFLFAGAGPRKKEILAAANGWRLPNFRYLDYFPRERMGAALSLADVHLLTLRNDMAGIAAPSKLYGIMASGRPVVMIGPAASEPGGTILDAGAGYVIDPAENRQAAARLVETILYLYEHADQRAQQGARGREAFLAGYEHRTACRAWSTLLGRLPPRRIRRGAQQTP